MDVCVLSHLKEEPAWAADKQLRVISTIMLFKGRGRGKIIADFLDKYLA